MSSGAGEIVETNHDCDGLERAAFELGPGGSTVQVTIMDPCSLRTVDELLVCSDAPGLAEIPLQGTVGVPRKLIPALMNGGCG